MRTDDKRISRSLTQTEDLILDLLATITADDHDELLAITAKGSPVTEVEIGRALHLVGRRGANFAFFFENVSDAVWLLPLETAGYFKQPPGITPAGDGSVTFQFWWPLLFLRRVAAQVPERVVEILLKMDRTIHLWCSGRHS